MYFYQFFRRIYLSIFLLISLGGCQAVRSNVQTTKPLPQDNFIKVYFNYSLSSEYQDPYRQKQRLGDDLEQQIINVINNAESSIDIAVQELRLPRIAEALVKKQKQGVKVRLILENNYSRPASNFTSEEINKLPVREQSRYQTYQRFIDENGDGKLTASEINQRDALVIINNAKIPRLDDKADRSQGSGLMHHKFVVVDNRFVAVSSANFTISDIHGDDSDGGSNYDGNNQDGNKKSQNTSQDKTNSSNFNSASLGNANNLIVIDSLETAAVFKQEFDLMWGNGVQGNNESKFGLQKPFRPPTQINIGNSRITINFSPLSPTQPWEETSNGLIAQKISQATKSIDLALFVFSEQQLANILAAKQQQNIKIRAILEPSFAFRYYSEGLDLLGVARSDKCSYEANNQPWKTPATVVVPQLAKGDLLHHKYALIDNRIVITGSHNWSEAANHKNDETLLIIENPTIAAHFQQETDRLYANSTPGLPPKLQAKIESENKQCPQIKTRIKPATFSSLNSGEKLNINTATPEELEALPGIGKKLAQKIIQTRQQKPLQSLSDLEKIPGVRPKTIEKIRDRITFK